jgi:hypothetical protein
LALGAIQFVAPSELCLLERFDAFHGGSAEDACHHPYCPATRLAAQRHRLANGRDYECMKNKGKRHAAILRALAFKGIRILWKCWKDRRPYDQAAYLKQLSPRKSPNAVADT